MPSATVHVGPQGARPLSALPTPSPRSAEALFDRKDALDLIDRAQKGEGRLYWCSNPALWVVVRNTPALRNVKGQVTERAERIEFRFKENLYLLPRDHKHRTEIEEFIPTIGGYGTLIRPIEEITRENKARALHEATRIMETIQPGEETRMIITALAPQLSEMSPEELSELFPQLKKNKVSREPQADAAPKAPTSPLVQRPLPARRTA